MANYGSDLHRPVRYPITPGEQFMKRTIILIPLTLALAGLTGCGGSGDSGGSKEVTPQSVAAAVNCTNVQPDTTEELYVKAVATCTLDGKATKIYTFADNTARDSYVQVAQSFGGSYDKRDRAVIVQGA